MANQETEYLKDIPWKMHALIFVMGVWSIVFAICCDWYDTMPVIESVFFSTVIIGVIGCAFYPIILLLFRSNHALNVKLRESENILSRTQENRKDFDILHQTQKERKEKREKILLERSLERLLPNKKNPE